jgi:hypothetical protein
MSMRLPELVALLGARLCGRAGGGHCPHAWLFTARDGTEMRMESNARDTPDAFVWPNAEPIPGSTIYGTDCLQDCGDILARYGTSEMRERTRPDRMRMLAAEREDKYGPVRAVALPP